MSSVGENKERLNRAYDPVRLNTAPPIFAFSNELNRTISRINHL